MEMGAEPRAGRVKVRGKTHPGTGYKGPKGCGDIVIVFR